MFTSIINRQSCRVWSLEYSHMIVENKFIHKVSLVRILGWRRHWAITSSKVRLVKELILPVMLHDHRVLYLEIGWYWCGLQVVSTRQCEMLSAWNNPITHFQLRHFLLLYSLVSVIRIGPPGSCDLVPLDFFVWRFFWRQIMKEKIQRGLGFSLNLEFTLFIYIFSNLLMRSKKKDNGDEDWEKLRKWEGRHRVLQPLFLMLPIHEIFLVWLPGGVMRHQRNSTTLMENVLFIASNLFFLVGALEIDANGKTLSVNMLHYFTEIVVSV